jgi:hypothetical protein
MMAVLAALSACSAHGSVGSPERLFCPKLLSLKGLDACTLLLSCCPVCLEDGSLLLLLDAPEGLLLSLLSEKDIPPTDSPAPCLLRCLLGELHGFQLSGDTLL